MKPNLTPGRAYSGRPPEAQVIRGQVTSVAALRAAPLGRGSIRPGGPPPLARDKSEARNYPDSRTRKEYLIRNPEGPQHARGPPPALLLPGRRARHGGRVIRGIAYPERPGSPPVHHRPRWARPVSAARARERLPHDRPRRPRARPPPRFNLKATP